MADYLEDYAARFELPVRTGIGVDRISRAGNRYVVEAGDERFEAENVIVASGAHRIPKVPAFAAELDPRIEQLHSSAYRRPGQLGEGAVLVVGLGNSGAEIAFELAQTHRVLQAGKPGGEIPVRHGSVPSRVLLPVLRFIGHHVLTRKTPIGRKVGPKLAGKATPLIRLKSKDLAAAGIEAVERVVGVRDGLPLLADGRVVEVENVVWCTGFQTDFSWIDVPAFAEDGTPLHDRGVVATAAGLYFMGLLFQFAETSDVLPGVGRDAAYVAKHIARFGAGDHRTGPGDGPEPTPREVEIVLG